MTRPLSIQLHTVREELRTDRDGTLRRLKEIGFDAVEPVWASQNDPAEYRAVLDDLELDISGMHCRIHREDPEPIFAAAKVLGTDHLIVPGGIPHDEFITREGLERVAKLLNGLAEQAAGHGLLVGYHNHEGEFRHKVDGRHAFEVLADLLDPEVFLEVDTYWVAVGGGDVVPVLDRLGNRVHALHIKDGPIAKGVPQTVVGQGKMAVPEIVAASTHTQLVVELDGFDGDMLTAVAESYAYLSRVVNEEEA